MDNPDLRMFSHRFDRLRNADDSKMALIQDLLVYCDRVNDLSRDLELSRRANHELLRESLELKRLQTQDPFVLVLLDGDGFIFTDALLEEGRNGGTKAVGMLENHIREYLATLKGAQALSNCKIVCRIYANTHGLAEAVAASGSKIQEGKVIEFMQGFTQTKALFDHVDVGFGNNRADHKIIENFKLDLINPRCHHIILGVSHDNGYRRMLEEHQNDPSIYSRVTLLEALPFARELQSLPFPQTRFEGLFRTSKIVTNAAASSQPRTWAALSRVRTNSLTPSHTPEEKPLVVAASRTKTPPTITPVLKLNKHGQRVDPLFNIVERSEYNRIKSLKLCNSKYLVGHCAWETSTCSNNHDYKPTPSELKILRQVARLAPCRYGLGCDNASCFSGHNCIQERSPAKYCGYGSKCRFPDEMHGVDHEVCETITI